MADWAAVNTNDVRDLELFLIAIALLLLLLKCLDETESLRCLDNERSSLTYFTIKQHYVNVTTFI